MIKVLNLYAGVGGNRKLWKNVKVTAVENNPEIAKIYKILFPNDKVVVADAHQYLLDHYNEFDFIWSSPPRQSHSSFRKNICVNFRGTKPIYPDLKLYEEIIFLRNHYKKGWVVENVFPYYEPLIPANMFLQRHCFWSNFRIKFKQFPEDKLRSAQIPDLQKKHKINLSRHNLKNKRQVLRNCVLPEIGLHILNCAKESKLI